MRFPGLVLLQATVLAAGAGCGGDGPTGAGTPAALTIVDGAEQTGTAGTALPVPVQVRVTSGRGGALSGVQVTFAVGPGSGFLSAVLNVTDESGQARATWTLGPAVGQQTLSVSVATLPPVTVGAVALAGPAAQVGSVAGAFQVVVVGRPVPVVPQARVTDIFGNGVGGTPVTFRVTAGGGTITDSIQTSGPDGLVTLGSWTLGPLAGTHSVRAAIQGNVGVDFTVLGIPATLTLFDGDGQTANAGTLVPDAPAVVARNDEGQPLQGAAVGWTVRSGGGRINGAATTQTDASGVATMPGWILGDLPGDNSLEAAVPTLAPIHFSATAVPGIPATVVAASPTEFPGFTGNFLSSLPAARVLDAAGRPVAGATVRFELTAGNGLILDATPVSDFNGVAALGIWRLGPGEGPQTVQAAVDGAPQASGNGVAPVVFTANATAPPPSAYNVEIRYTDTQPTGAQLEAFERARARWQQALIGDLPSIPINRPADSFGCYPAMNEVVDDIVIFAQLVTIDGPGGVLGQARPCLIRTASGIPVVGMMQFDVADLAFLEELNLLETVILHEMAHVIGFFHFIWPASLATGIDGEDPFFRGTTTRAAFRVATGGTFTGNAVPLENAGGPGSRNSHWRRSVLGDELMTSTLSGGTQPLSAITIGLFRDFGFVVNDAVGDAYTLAAAALELVGPRIPMIHGAIPGPIERVDHRGRTTGVLFR